MTLSQGIMTLARLPDYFLDRAQVAGTCEITKTGDGTYAVDYNGEKLTLATNGSIITITED